MPGRAPQSDRGLARICEQQMRNWELRKAQRPEHLRSLEKGVWAFVTISRMPGAGGFELATRLSETLGWPLFDKDILNRMAEDDRIRARLYESMDERDLGWLEQMLRLMMGSEFRRNDYLRQLTRTVLTIARQGNAVFLGRGVHMILPEAVGVRVRVVAPLADCVQRYSEHFGVATDDAHRAVASLEGDRRRFLQQYFGTSVEDPECYDLILNLGRLSPSDGVAVILAALKARGGLGQAD